MKSFRVASLMLIVVISASLLFSCSYAMGELFQDERNDFWLILHLRDYATDMPISNTSITLTISTSREEVRFGPFLTNETGIVQFSISDALALISTENPVLKLEISNNYTLIKINEMFLEDLQYTGEYSQNHTRYVITKVTQLRDIFEISQIPLKIDNQTLSNRTFIEANLWVLKGKLIKISDSDPITGMRGILSVKPAVKAIIENETSDYERSYFFPLGYTVTIIHKPKSYAELTYPPLKVTVDENTTLINWMYHAAEAYTKFKNHEISDKIDFFNSSGFSLNREIEEYSAIKKLLHRVLDLYQKREYGSALGGARIARNKLNNLETWLSNLESFAVLTSIGIYLFVYGLASLIPALIFEDPMQNKPRLLSKVLIFSILILAFSLSHPSLKMTYAIIISRLIGSPTFSVDLPITISGCFILGSSIYFLITLLSIKKSPLTDLALQLGVRNLKRRTFRSILTLITITIIVFSSIVFVNVSVSRSTKVKSTWMGTTKQGVLIEPNIRYAPLSEYDVNWTRTQKWCKDLGYIEQIRSREPRGAAMMIRSGVISKGEPAIRAEIVAVDPEFMEKYYNLSRYVRGFYKEFLYGKKVAIVSSSFDIQINEYIPVGVDEILYTNVPIPLGIRTLGDFRVIGNFDPLALSKLTKIDGTPLFKDASNLVLIPIGAIEDPAICISEVTVILHEKFDPVEVAEEISYTLGVATVANRDGLARRIEWSLELSISGLIPFLVPLAITGLMVYNTMASVYEERKREFTTLATLGLDPKNTFKLFMVEGALLGLIGTLFGFIGSYIFVMILDLWRIEMPGLSISSTIWSISAILVALFTGITMTFLGSYIPAVRAQGLSLMGRVKKRRFVGELITEGETTSFTLPIRETVQNSEILYTYIRETLRKTKVSRIDEHSIKGEIFGDGSFSISFVISSSGGSVFIPFEIRGVREGEMLIPTIYFPTKYQVYGEIRDILRDLEEQMISFSAWKEMQLKLKVIREAPKKRKTLEEILEEIRNIISQIKDCDRKLKMLETQKDKISEEVYDEFRQKYVNLINGYSKRVRTMAIELEPHSRQLLKEIRKIEIEVERFTTAYNLGEISEEEYVKTCGPLQGRLTDLKRRLKEIEEIYEFLKMPSKTRTT